MSTWDLCDLSARFSSSDDLWHFREIFKEISRNFKRKILKTRVKKKLCTATAFYFKFSLNLFLLFQKNCMYKEILRELVIKDPSRNLEQDLYLWWNGIVICHVFIFFFWTQLGAADGAIKGGDAKAPSFCVTVFRLKPKLSEFLPEVTRYWVHFNIKSKNQT